MRRPSPSIDNVGGCFPSLCLYFARPHRHSIPRITVCARACGAFSKPLPRSPPSVITGSSAQLRHFTTTTTSGSTHPLGSTLPLLGLLPVLASAIRSFVRFVASAIRSSPGHQYIYRLLSSFLEMSGSEMVIATGTRIPYHVTPRYRLADVTADMLRGAAVRSDTKSKFSSLDLRTQVYRLNCTQR